MQKFDVIVVGGGPAGYVAAIHAAKKGLSTALCEYQDLGGTCLNWGCIPTKALLKTAEAWEMLQKMPDLGIQLDGSPKLDLSVAVKRSRKVAMGLKKGLEGLMKKHKISVFSQKVRIHEPLHKDFWTLSDNQDNPVLSGRHIILATGAKAKSLPYNVPDQCLWNASKAMTPDTLPQSLIIIGSGAIGMEFACFYNTLGSKVTVIEIQDKILPTEDTEISHYAENVFRRKGIEILKNARIDNIESHEKDQCLAKISVKDTLQKIVADKILVAVGVQGVTENLGLNHTSATIKNSWIETDYWGRTQQPFLYAIGDVTGGPCLAHKASYQALQCINGITNGFQDPSPHTSLVPSCVYTLPEIASVGMTEQEARQKNIPLKVGKSSLSINGKALASMQSEGFIKCLFHEKTGEILGVHMIGANVTEMIALPTFAHQVEAVEQDLFNTIFPHPTLSEALQEAAGHAWGQEVHG